MDKQSGWTELRERFINPYNFVPFDGVCIRGAGEEKKSTRYTGYFQCGLKLLTPVFIPNTSCDHALPAIKEEWLRNQKQRKKKNPGECPHSYDFYSYDDLSNYGRETLHVPVIPGSEIRGMVRSVYEAAFNGCMSSVSMDRVIKRKRETQNAKIEDSLKKHGGYQPCDNREQLCPACAVFGMAQKSGQKTSAMGSRVRFTDARIKSLEALDGDSLQAVLKEYYDDPIVVEQGEPKPSAVEFYTAPPFKEKAELEEWEPDIGYWTYDYKLKKRRIDRPKNRTEFGKDHLKLRGRKFYWHGSVETKRIKGDINSPMAIGIRPLKNKDENQVFEFRVYFDKLTEGELKKLLWSLNFNDDGCAHKIGRAKPLGLGSVKVQVQEVVTREIDPATGLWSLVKQIPEVFPGVYEGKESKAMKILKMMVNWEQRPKGKISYPIGLVNKQFVSYQWFNGNQEMTKNNNKSSITHGAVGFAKVLPKPEEELDLKCEGKWLYTLEKSLKAGSRDKKDVTDWNVRVSKINRK